MMHNLKLIRRRFPNQADTIVTTLALLSLSALAVGAGLLWLF